LPRSKFARQYLFSPQFESFLIMELRLLGRAEYVVMTFCYIHHSPDTIADLWSTSRLCSHPPSLYHSNEGFQLVRQVLYRCRWGVCGWPPAANSVEQLAIASDQRALRL
jgi:hypothetical protein